MTKNTKPLRVAFYGDMNNNYFSFMRYLRDLGVDAHLFLYKDQDTNQPRWAPKSDTNEWDKWKDFVHHTNCRDNWRDLIWGDIKSLRKDFNDFDVIFISGFAAALFAKAGIKIDYFLPYAVGIEILNRVPRKGLGFIDRLMIKWQKRGVISAQKVIIPCGDKQTEKKAISLGLDYDFYTSVPMVYRESTDLELDKDARLSRVIEAIGKSDFVVSSHVRHDWINASIEYPGREKIIYSKRTDILIKGFAQFLRKTKSRSPLLLLAEYGDDVLFSKELCRELEIENHVHWFSELKRKQIMQFLPLVDVTGGEFDGSALTGGVFLESLAAGKPLLHALPISNEEYLEKTGCPLPPVVNCSDVEDVATALLTLEADKEKRLNIGQQSKVWFDEYAGIGLAKKFLDDFKVKSLRHE